MLVRCVRAAASASQRNVWVQLRLCSTADDAPPRWLNAYAPLLVYALDGKGGATRLDPLNEHAMTRAIAKIRRLTSESAEAPVGMWIHSDFKSPKTNSWLRRVGGRRVGAQTASWARENSLETQPSFTASPSSDAFLLTLRTAQGLPTEREKLRPKLIPFHAWLTRTLLITSAESMPRESDHIYVEIERQLLNGKGSLTCGSLAAAIIERTAVLSMLAAKDAEYKVVSVRERLKVLTMGSSSKAQLEQLRTDLAHVEHDVVMLRRHLLPQHATLESLIQFCQLPQQNIFSPEDISCCTRSKERYQTLRESLDAAQSGIEVLKVDILEVLDPTSAEAARKAVAEAANQAQHEKPKESASSGPILLPTSEPSITPMVIGSLGVLFVIIFFLFSYWRKTKADRLAMGREPLGWKLGSDSKSSDDAQKSGSSSEQDILFYEMPATESRRLSFETAEDREGKLSEAVACHLENVIERLDLLSDVEKKRLVIDKLISGYQNRTFPSGVQIKETECQLCIRRLNEYRDSLPRP